MESSFREICNLDINLYRCISESIDTERVVLTDKSMLHIETRHPEVSDEVIDLLRDVIIAPDFIIRDDKHAETGLVVKKLFNEGFSGQSVFVVLRVCTDSHGGKYANSVLSAWKVGYKRLQNYLRNKEVLYRYADF